MKQVTFPISYDAVKEKLLYEKTAPEPTEKASKQKTAKKNFFFKVLTEF